MRYVYTCDVHMYDQRSSPARYIWLPGQEEADGHRLATNWRAIHNLEFRDGLGFVV